MAHQNEDTPRVVLAGNHKIVFLIRGPIYLICVSRTMEPTAHLARQLQFVYTQVCVIMIKIISMVVVVVVVAVVVVMVVVVMMMMIYYY